MRWLAVSFACVALAGCGESPAPGDEPGSATGATTVGPGPPEPPPAFVATSQGRLRLAQSTYCWTSEGTGVCADHVAPACDDGHTPRIDVRRGEEVRFELGFDPDEVSVLAGGATGEPLEAGRAPTWHVSRSGAIVLFARAEGLGDTSYGACFRLVD